MRGSPFIRYIALVDPEYADPLTSTYQGGHQIIQQSAEDRARSIIPQTLHGKVLLTTEGTIAYSPLILGLNKDNNGQGNLKGYGVYVRTIRDESLKDPDDIIAQLTKPNNTLTQAEKEALQLQWLSVIHMHPLVVPKNVGERKPLIGEMLYVHIEASLRDAGEKIKGYYECITTNNSDFDSPSTRKIIRVLSEIKKPNDSPEIAKGEENAEIVALNDYQDCTDFADPKCQTIYVDSLTKAYCQSVSPWGDKPFYANSLMKDSGCLLTCMTMMANYFFGQTLYTPLDVIKKFQDWDNDFSKSTTEGASENLIFKNSSKIILPYAASALGIDYVGEATNKTTDFNGIRDFANSSLEQKNAVIFQVDYKLENKTIGFDDIGDHFILCLGYDKEKNYICNDPIIANGKAFIVDSKRMSSRRPSSNHDEKGIYHIIRAISFKLNL